MNGVSKISVCDEIALVSFQRIPSDIATLASIFTRLANAKVNLDMISQTAPQGHLIGLSFTLRSEQLVEVLELINQFRETHPDIKPMVSNGNCKIQLYGEEMREMYGVAASAIEAISEIDAELTLNSTGEVEISLLVPKSSCDAAVKALEEKFSVKPEYGI